MHQQQRSPSSTSMRRRQWPHPVPHAPVRCPRCNSYSTNFSYYNNYNVNQPRHLCKTCRRHWTVGGALRDVDIAIGRRGRNSHPGPALDRGQPRSPRSRLVRAISTNTARTSSSTPTPRSDALPQMLPSSPATPPQVDVHGQAPIDETRPSLRCPRCHSYATRFSYYNNHNMNQPRYYCKSCRRHWTDGGKLRNVPVGRCVSKPRRTTARSTTTRFPSWRPMIGSLPQLGQSAEMCIGAGCAGASASSNDALAEFMAILSNNSVCHEGRSGGGMLSILELDDTPNTSDANVGTRHGINNVGVMVPMTLHDTVPCTFQVLPSVDSRPHLCNSLPEQHVVLPSIGTDMLTPSMPNSAAETDMNHLHTVITTGADGRRSQACKGGAYSGINLPRPMEFTSIPRAQTSGTLVQPIDGAAGVYLQQGSFVTAPAMQHMTHGTVGLSSWCPVVHGPGNSFA